jgi:hypothetical protein|tara:strand:- start:39 stop:4379 length:4341 start_codon:yes stop_codon:yes gene_type:complete
MPISEAEAFGPTRSAKRKKANETGFIESALAGVASGLIKIPESFVSLGAEIFDLFGDTDTATSVEKFFDDLNPFEDEAEARTVGKITTALAQIGIPAFQGAKIGMGLAKKAIDARKIGKYAELSRFGKVINNVKNSQLAGGIGGAAVGEALVSDEEIGTLGDMLKGTSLEPVAFTMMDRDKKEGREEAFRRLTNRIKFGIDGSIFNLGIAGAGKGISALRKPTELGLQRYGEGTIKEIYEKYIRYGLNQAGMLDEVSAEGKRRVLDAAEAFKFDAGKDVDDLFDAVKEVIPNIETSIFKNEEGLLNSIKKVMQPIPGKKAESIKATDLPDIIEAKSGLKNNARKLLEFTETKDGFRRLKTAEGPDGLFTPGDYEIIKGGEFDKLLRGIENSMPGKKGRDAAIKFQNLVIKMRNGVDNMTGKILNKNLQKDMSIKLQSELGNYLTADYRHFDKSIFPFFRTSDAAAAQRQEALKYYTAAKLTEEAAIRRIPIATLKQNADFMQQVTKDGDALITKYLTTKNIDDPAIDLLRQDKTNIKKLLTGEPRTPSGGIDKAAAKLEDQVIKTNPEILQGKKLNEFEEIIFGRITDPKHTYLSSITKMATLNSTLELMEDVGRIGSKKFLKDGVTPNPGRYVFGDGTEEGAIRDFLNLPEGTKLSLEQRSKGLAALQDPKQFKKVEALKNSKLAGLLPLENKYVRAPFYDDIFETTVQFLNTNKIGMLYKYGVLAPKAVSQITKTILSPITHARNLISAGAFAAANGAIVPTGTDYRSLLPESLGGDIFKAGKIIDPKTGKGVGLLETAKRITYGRIRGTMTRQDRDLYERLLKVGMVKTNPITGELDRLSQDFYKNAFVDPAMTETKTFRGFANLAQKGKRFYGKVQDAYVAEDDYWKTITWGLERNRYQEIFKNGKINATNFKKVLEGTEKGVSEQLADYVRQGVKRNIDPITGTFTGTYDDFLDEFAANLSRNLVPNYSYIGRTGKALRLSPFGNFIAFPLEILRTGSNILEQGIKERATGIPELVSLGNKRILSFGLTVGGIPKIMQEGFKAMHDVDEEEMEALRRVVPEWSKNSTLLPMGRDKNGYLKYVDFSYSNAYDTLLRPFNTVLNAIAEGKNDETSLKQSLGEGLQESAVELLKPFTTESIFTEALVDSTIRRGIGREGRRVWDQADDPFIKIVKGFGHIAKSFEPGSYRQLERLGNSLLGKTDPKYGKEYNVFDELPGLAGFGIKTADPERSLVYKTSQFGSDLKKSENLFTSQLLKGGRVSPEDIINRYQYSEQARFQVLKKMAKDVDAMRELGMPDYKIKKELKKRKGLSSKVISDVMLGVYTPKRPTNFFIQRTGEINRDLNRKEGNAVPNPYFKALPVINGIINKNRRVDLLEGSLGMSDFNYERTKQEPRITTPNLTSAASVNPAVVQSQNVSSTLPANFASLPTAERSKIIEEFFTT